MLPVPPPRARKRKSCSDRMPPYSVYRRPIAFCPIFCSICLPQGQKTVRSAKIVLRTLHIAVCRADVGSPPLYKRDESRVRRPRAEPLAFRVRPSVRAFAHWCGSARFARLSFARFIQRSSASVIARRSSSASDKEMPSFSSRSIYSTFFFSRTGALTMSMGARRSAAAAANTDDKISG